MSYAQHSEDQFLADYFNDVLSGFFCEIGANDGIKGSNTRGLWERGWSGVMVEGCYSTFQALLKNYDGQPRIRFVHAAVGSKVGVVEFFEHKTIKLCGWNSMDKGFIESMDRSNFSPTLVPACTIAELGLPMTFEFLSIDTEGSDYDVLSCLPAWMRPRLILAEVDKHGNDARITDLLAKWDYRKIWFEQSDGSNAAYEAAA